MGSLSTGHNVVGLGLENTVVGLTLTVVGASVVVVVVVVVVLGGRRDASGCVSDVDGRELASTVTTLLTLDKSSVVNVLASVQAAVVTFASSGSLQQAPSRKPSMQADSMVPSWRMHSQLNMQSPVSPCTPSHGLLPIVHCFQGVTEV